MAKVLGWDPSLSCTAMSLVESERGKFRVLWHGHVETTPTLDTLRRLRIVSEFVASTFRDVKDARAVALEDQLGVSFGKSASGNSSAATRVNILIQGQIQHACFTAGSSLLELRSQTVYATIGASIKRVPNEPKNKRRDRQKAATKAVIGRIVSGTEDMIEDEFDATAIAVAAILKGHGR